MKTNFTKKQYRLLLDLVFAGDMMINGHKLRGEVIKEYDELRQHIYSFAKDFGFKNLIQYDPKYQGFLETREFEQSTIYELMDEHEDEVFWDQLAYNLAKRDALQEFEGQELVAPEKVFKRICEIEASYHDEFCENGLKNIQVEKSV